MECSLTYRLLVGFPKFVIIALLCHNYFISQQYGSNKKKNLSNEQKGFYKMERKNYFFHGDCRIIFKGLLHYILSVCPRREAILSLSFPAGLCVPRC